MSESEIAGAADTLAVLRARVARPVLALDVPGLGPVHCRRFTARDRVAWLDAMHRPGMEGADTPDEPAPHSPAERVNLFVVYLSMALCDAQGQRLPPVGLREVLDELDLHELNGAFDAVYEALQEQQSTGPAQPKKK